MSIQKNNFLTYYNKYMPLAAATILAEQDDIAHEDVVAAVSDGMDATAAGFAIVNPEYGALASAAASIAKLFLPWIVSLAHRNKANVAFAADPTKAPPIPLTLTAKA